MNGYRHKLIVIKAVLTAEYGISANINRLTPNSYSEGFYDAIDICLQLVSNAIREADKEENNG